MPLLLSSKERFALGRDRRKQMRRVDHATWDASARRANPLKLLDASMHGRVPSLVAMKYELMAVSPFGFYRGAVPVMAYDLSLIGNTGIVNQLCGDAHVRNLGAFAGPDGRLVFDINDYDETIAGPFEWDVKRMAASLVLAGREAGAKDIRCSEAVALFAEQYRTNMLEFARMPVLELARYQVHRLRTVSPVEGILRLAERATPRHTLLTLTEIPPREEPKKGQTPERPQRIFKTVPPNLTRLTGDIANKVVNSLEFYAESLQRERRHFLAQYKPVDVAFKVVGTGSVGLRDYCVYMEGNSTRDPLFLQIKEEVKSGYAPYVKRAWTRGIATHQGRRVVEGERSMQVQSDPFLGWTSMEGREYLVRQLNDHKAAIQLQDLRTVELLEYAGVCGEMLARGHARSGDSSMVAGYLGTSERFDDAVAKFAMAYADQTEKDWEELVKSLKTRSSRPMKKTVKKALSKR
jgi:uncharacterized protein (DUF2252 family)